MAATSTSGIRSARRRPYNTSTAILTRTGSNPCVSRVTKRSLSVITASSSIREFALSAINAIVDPAPARLADARLIARAGPTSRFADELYCFVSLLVGDFPSLGCRVPLAAKGLELIFDGIGIAGNEGHGFSLRGLVS